MNILPRTGWAFLLALTSLIAGGTRSCISTAHAEPLPLIRAVGCVGLTVSDADRSADFYTRVLSFEKTAEIEQAGEPIEQLEGVFGARTRTVRVRLGRECLDLTEYLAPRGRPAPPDARSNDRSFQHVAIVVSDMDRAYAALRVARVEHASTGPQRLPDWNPNAGRIRAFYFRDPDRHVLEVLQFPRGKGDARWQRGRFRFPTRGWAIRAPFSRAIPTDTSCSSHPSNDSPASTYLKGTMTTREEQRLADAGDRKAHWKRWGPYLSERAWGTVREDYSTGGTAWDHLPHDHARSRAYRWNEDGLAGISDRRQELCFAVALWNRRDPILKERLFGLTGQEGNHGEDVKELYYYLDSTPTHSYMKYLYKYPQAEFPYARLVEENRRRGRAGRELELIDTGVFEGDRYFDVFVEYAKADVEDLCIRIEVANRGPQQAELDLLPTLWFRNTWSWENGKRRPSLRANAPATVQADHAHEGRRFLHCEGQPELLFTENETNVSRLFGSKNGGYVKDGINDFVVSRDAKAVNPDRIGTKCAARYLLTVPPRSSVVVRLRLSTDAHARIEDVDAVFAARKREADDFYGTVIPSALSEDGRNVMRQALAGMLWSKQFYHYVVRDWLGGDSHQPPPPQQRKGGRNNDWMHLYNADVLSMPD